MKAIAIGGLPASGKSTILRNLIDRVSTEQLRPFKFGLVNGSEDMKRLIFWMGQYKDGEKFGGTDRFSMACQPHAERFVEFGRKHLPEKDYTFVFEGDRLFNIKFLTFLEKNVEDLRIYIVRAKEETLEARHKDRGDTQTEIWLKGRKTKIQNIANNFEGRINFLDNETDEDLERNIAELTQVITNERE